MQRVRGIEKKRRIRRITSIKKVSGIEKAIKKIKQT